jgi:hypothetical protein
MLVVLKRDCFLDGVRYRASKTGFATDVPTRLKRKLPADAKIVQEQPEGDPVDDGPATLSEAAALLAPDFASEVEAVAIAATKGSNKPAPTKGK